MVNRDFSDLFAAFNEAGKEDLIANKTAAARPQDLLDIDVLRRH